MTDEQGAFYASLSALGEPLGDPLPVTLSPELVGLLSEQLYRSPSKAIEELVVNGFDAEADECRMFVPEGDDVRKFISVFDDGVGMSYDGLADLWKVGRPKVRDESLFDRKGRRQIGKFGIGKLATYAVASRVTYVTHSEEEFLAVTINYRDFASNAAATTTEVKLDVRRIETLRELWNDATFRAAAEALDLDEAHLATIRSSWTLVILEDLKEKARAIGLGRLRWVLRTAMPMSPEFRLFLNREEVVSSKEDHEILVEFDVIDLPDARLRALSTKTGETWTVSKGGLTTTSFPLGIKGNAIVTRQTLEGKSAGMMRSEGFFVYVRGRLVNEEDARFGLHELSHATLNRFRAEIRADDLDQVVTANRESMEDVALYRNAQAVLNEIFNEARQRYEDHEERVRVKGLGERESSRKWVPERLVEYPTADVLTKYAGDSRRPEADDSWMYLTVDPSQDIGDVVRTLYSVTGRNQPYAYHYAALGRAGRMVQFDPVNLSFMINQDHELVQAYANDPGAQRLVEDLVTGEALLEIYLREAGVSAHVIGEVLERRDLLLRGLADAHMFSLTALSAYVSNSASDKNELEIAVVAGARALGFVAKHVGGVGEPDGVARFTDFPAGEQKIILEAKSSLDTPSAKDIDFASISTHKKKHGAIGCLLVAPGYQGDETGNAARAAQELEISCWTVRQFADVIAAAESRQISARQVLEIVSTRFTPGDVAAAVGDLLEEPAWAARGLYVAIINALRNIQGYLADTPRNVGLIALEVARNTEFSGVSQREVEQAISHLAGASQGALLARPDGVVILNVDYDELERRVQGLTGRPGRPRREGAFGEAADMDA